MCGRYALALRPSQIRQMLQDDGMPAADYPEDDAPNAPRQSHNFAPGYHGIVYRADTSDRGAGRADGAADGDADPKANQADVEYKLQSMRWGLIPFWTKRNPGYASMMKTINCRDDSLATPGGMWATMKARKRCIVIAQGFFEWLKVSPKEKLPHFVRRKDGRLMCFAGLWDCVQYEDSDEKVYTFTIVTTDSNPQLRFLHDRMPVILDPGSYDLQTWLDPRRREWSPDLQKLLKPFHGEVDVYPVSKDVGKVGNDSPNFLVPIDSKENKSNIANFFAKGPEKDQTKKSSPEKLTPAKADGEQGTSTAVKRGPTPEKAAASPSKRTKKDQPHAVSKKISAKKNTSKPISPAGKSDTPKITSFFKK